MSDLLERDLRGALAERAARLTPQASARLRAVDYRPRARRLPSRRLLGAVGLSGVAAAAGAVILIGSTAEPAFAGWTAHPTAPRLGQLAAAQLGCGTGAGSPVLSDTRGPYTASIYADGSTCLEGNAIGNGITTASSRAGGAPPSVPAGKIQLNGLAESDSSGQTLTMVDGRIGAGVTGVTITRSDGTAVQATVANGWYLAWWPGTQRAVTARVATTSATATQSFPSPPAHSAPACPAGAQCSSSYGFQTGSAHGTGRGSTGTAVVGTSSGVPTTVGTSGGGQ